MKIGIDARFIGPKGTGIGTYTQNLIAYLQKIDTINHYLIFLKKENWHNVKINNKFFSKALADVSWYSIEEQLKMASIFKRSNLDLVHVPHFNVPIFYSGKFIITIHDLIHHHFPQTVSTTKNPVIFKLKRLGYHLIFKNALTRSKKIIVPSNFVKEDLIANCKVNPSKIAVTYEAVEEEYLQKTHHSQLITHHNLIYVGNAYPHKNLPMLLNAFKRLITRNLSLITKLIIVSPRDIFAQRLVTEIKKRNLQDKVELLGWQNSADLVKLFAKSTAYVSPSLSEGFGIPGLNAMAANIPVICSDIPTFREIYSDAAVYFNPKDPNDIAKKIQKVLSDNKQKSDLVKKGREQVKKYSWLKMAKQTLEIYKSVLS